MKAKYFILMFLGLHQIVALGQKTIKSVDTKNFPVVNFSWSSYNPEVIAPQGFSITEDGVELSTNVTSEKDTLYDKRLIHIIWEDMEELKDGNKTLYKDQFDYYRNFMLRFIQKLEVNANSRFAVSIYDSKGENDESAIRNRFPVKGYTSNLNELFNGVKNYVPQYDINSKALGSELYFTLAEVINDLPTNNSDELKVILLFSTGRNKDTPGGKNSAEDVLLRANELNIPIYLIKFPASGFENSYYIDEIVKKSYGKVIKEQDVDVAVDKFLNFYNAGLVYHSGFKYAISFTSLKTIKKVTNTAELNVNGSTVPVNYIVPPFNFIKWILDHLILAIILGVVIITLVVILVVFLLKRKHKKILAQIEESNEMLERTRKNQEKLENLSKQMHDNNAPKKPSLFQIKVENEKLFQQNIVSRSLSPRLKCEFDGKEQYVEIKKSLTTIGRKAGNDITIPVSTVSGQHAIIEYNQNGFTVIDNNSANKVIIRNKAVKSHVLKNLDKIKLGGANITFYI